ncbi:MAG: hypothetical protein EOO73_01125 [Myxococcales bacterium]|nr:MAG: hypothetical protein EOO73_01125 [Myxococcales bacterium]
MALALRTGALALLLLSCASGAPLEPLPTYPVPARLIAPAPARVTSKLPAPPGPLPALPESPPGSLPAISLGDIGLAGPVEVLSSSSSGAWVALCDSERRARLVVGSGPGEVVDELLAEDARGRYVVVADGEGAQLVDAAKGSRVNLRQMGADVRRIRADYAAHRALSFDASGQYLAYSRRQSGAPTQLVVRDLEAGTERSFSLGPGELLRLELSADARYVTFEAIREDTNKNGRYDWPAPEEAPRKGPCGKPPLRFRSFSYQGRGDVATRGVLRLADGAMRDVPELVTTLGAALLLRAADGALVLDQGGKRTPLAPASCAARALFTDAERQLVLAACAPPPPKRVKGKPLPPPTGKREVWLFGPGLALDLHRELYETAVDRGAELGARLVPLYPGSEANLVDLERRELLPLPAGSRVLATQGPFALIWRDSDLYRYDAQAKREERLVHGVWKTPELLRAGGAVLLSPFLVTSASGPAFTSPERPLALTAEGFVLTGSSEGAGSVIEGPLHWVDARLPPPDGPPR